MNGNLAYQDPIREERVNGRTVAMSPRPNYNHNHIAFRIAVLFDKYLEGRTCTTIADGTDLYLSEEDRFVPDVMVVCDREKIQDDGVHGAPDLVVEVLSPSTAKRDRTYKKDCYSKHGVREYWLVNPADRSVEIYRSNGSGLEFHDLYHLYSERMLSHMTEEERAEVVTTFQCSLYDDLDISLEDIFKGMIP